MQPIVGTMALHANVAMQLETAAIFFVLCPVGLRCAYADASNAPGNSNSHATYTLLVYAHPSPPSTLSAASLLPDSRRGPDTCTVLKQRIYN